MEQQEILVKSTLDGSLQPSLLFRAKGKRPVLVGLHSWSYGRENQVKSMTPWAEKYGFHLLLPQFRGPNLTSNPQCRDACGSPLAKQDIIDAVDFPVVGLSIGVPAIKGMERIRMKYKVNKQKWLEIFGTDNADDFDEIDETIPED